MAEPAWFEQLLTEVQTIHAVLPELDTKPDGQLEHDIAPTEALYVCVPPAEYLPSGHSLQASERLWHVYASFDDD